MPSTGERVDPLRGFKFVLDIDGIGSLGCSEISGLEVGGDPVEYREGTDPNTVRKLETLRTYSNLTVRRGYTQRFEFWEWIQNVYNGTRDRRNGFITLLNEAGQPVMRWSFVNGYANRITGPSFNATSNDVAMEELEIVIEGLFLDPNLQPTQG